MRVVDEFRARTGREPGAVASAPGRVNLIGEHLDYNGGRSLPIALPYRTYVAAAARPDGRTRVQSLQSQDIVEVGPGDALPGGWAAYVLGVVEALRERDVPVPGLDLLVDGQVPIGAGLSSSAALECAVALAASRVAGVEVDREDLVTVCVRAENDFVGARTGSMDQTVALFAEAGHALLVDFRDTSRRLVPWRPPGELLVVDTKVQHALAGGEYAARRSDCEEAAGLLGVERLVDASEEALAGLEERLRRRARHVRAEQARVDAAVAAIRDDDWQRLGELMTASHMSLRDDYEVSCAELDVAVDAALSAGALGARMTGGGFGGCAIALVPPGLGQVVRAAVTGAFLDRGLVAPEFLDGTAGPAARLEATAG